MTNYTFRKEDARDFADFVGIQTKSRNGQLHFVRCPYCRGGQHRDEWTFGISLSTGQFHCNRDSCGANGNMLTLARDFDFRLPGVDLEERQQRKEYRSFKTPEKPIEPKPPAIAYLESRGISAETAKRYEITTQTDRDNVLVFPFYDQDGKLTFVKYRKTDFDKEKDKAKEWCEKNGKPILFGMKQAMPPSEVPLVITEGQLDSLSVEEASDGTVSAVSVPTGAKGFTWVPHCWEWVNRYSKIIVFGDHENGHMSLLDEIRVRFKKRIFAVKPQNYKDCKDANEILVKYGPEQIRKCLTDLQEILPTHVKQLADVGKVNVFDMPKLPTGLDCLDRLLFGGLPFGGVTLISGKPGQGKSTLASQIIINALESGHKVFAYSGELSNELFRAWMDYQVAGKQHIFQYQTRWGDTGYNISDANRDRISDWYRDKIYLYDSSDVDDENVALLNIAEEMILKNGVDVILVDNLMTALDLEALHESDKYERQSKFVKKLTRIAKNYNVLVLLVAHKRKNNFSTTETDEISGSGDIGNLGMVMLSYERGGENVPEEDRVLKVAKNRLFGRENHEGWVLHYDEASKRIFSTGAELSMEYSWAKDAEMVDEQDYGFSELSKEDQMEIPF